MLNRIMYSSLVLLLLGCNYISDRETTFTKPPLETNPSAQPLSPQESMETIHLPPGYNLELVASEPMVQEPVAIAWDGNGRMYVAEMQTYMQDVDGTGTQRPISRISRLEDTDGDGQMDTHSVFIDSLVLPRMMLPLDGRLIIGETYTYDLWSYKDTNGDGRADEKVKVYENNDTDNRNLEHQASALNWNLDNWIYVGRDPVRFQYAGGKIIADTLNDPPLSQWGVTHDDYGRLYFSLAGGEIPALGFQMNPQYGDIRIDGELAEDFQATWPIVITPDAQGGKQRLRDDSTLNHFTASCGQSIYRGGRLPEEMQGDLFICEPVGRLIRRAKVTKNKGKIVLQNAYEEQEFLSSTDLNFRPVNTATGPDGALYIVDMYRGIIQESNWTREGSYIRPVIKRLGLDKNIGRGRIYRLVHEDFEPYPKPQLLDKSATELVEYLNHPNGWWRDRAQQLLIVKNDTSVVPMLKEMAFIDQSVFGNLFGNNPKPVSRIHALWTLDGMGAINRSTVQKALEDPHPQVRKTGIRLSENFMRDGDTEILDRLMKLKNDPSAEVRIQLVASLRYSQTRKAQDCIQEMMERYNENDLLVTVAQKSLEGKDLKQEALKDKTDTVDSKFREMVLTGASIFRQSCAACHGTDGRGLSIGDTQKLAPSLYNSERIKGSNKVLSRILLGGLEGPIDGKEYPGVMPSMRNHNDEWIASVINYLRVEFGKNDALVTPSDIKAIREKTEGRDQAWSLEQLEQFAR